MQKLNLFVIEKKIIGIAYGGYTSEYGISKQSAENVFELLKEKYSALYKINITIDRWIVEDRFNNTYELNKKDFTFTKEDENIKFDCIFNAIHGAPGEDGTFTSLLDSLKIPYTSCSSKIAALTYNKKETNLFANQFGIAVAPNYIIKKGEQINIESIVEKIGLPCFVKPNSGGSSFGISKNYQKKEMLSSIEKAFEESDEVLIESFLEGREFSVGIIPWKGKYKVLPITEIISDNDFFDYEAKYKGKSKEITPAIISPSLQKEIETTLFNLYEKFKIDSFSRSEFIVVDDVPYLLDINTVPGLTSSSILPQQIEAAGICLKDFYDSLLVNPIK